MGMTRYEQAEELGEPAFRQVANDRVVVWERLPGSPEYAVVGAFYVSNSGPQLSGLSFEPWSRLPWPPPLLTTAMFRLAPIDLLYERARGYLSIAEQIGVSLDVDLNEFENNRRPGRRGRPDLYYAELAKQYVDLLAESSTPTKDLAQRLNYSPSSTRDLLHQARRRGLLSSPATGLAGGELTEKAKRLLTVESSTE